MARQHQLLYYEGWTEYIIIKRFMFYYFPRFVYMVNVVAHFEKDSHSAAKLFFKIARTEKNEAMFKVCKNSNKMF